MTVEWWVFLTPPHLDAALSPTGFLILAAEILVFLVALFLTRRDFAALTMRIWMLFGGLALISAVLGRMIILTLPLSANAALPPFVSN